ncbi:MAG TPA: transglycosylase domain-containing protein, partial [Bacteroidales bacterium]|nr:transglycosylase domain-containing protein [Bacteroidales bacterium]
MAKSNKKKSKTKNTGIRKFIKIIGITLLVLFLLSILIPILYRWVNPPITPLMVIRKVSNGATIEKEWKDLEDISPDMVNCAVAAEDNNFLGHDGFDWKAIQRAIDENKQGKRERGASTISQQTAKNVFLTTHHSWIRKGMET